MAKKGNSSVPPTSSSTSSSSSGISTTKTTTTAIPTKGNSSNTSLIQKPPFSLCHPELSLSSSPSTFADTFEGVARLLQGRKNIVVLVGAGISVSCGIPDFRSKGSGLYSTLDIEGLGLSCPEELFDWEFFQEDPVPFFKFARNLYFPLGGGGGGDGGTTSSTKKVEPSDSHKLLAMLEQKKMLLRVYSQNIDGLETVAGVSPKRMVYAHGSLQWATCCKCQRKVSSEEILPAIQQGTVPRCQAERRRGSSKSKPTTPTIAERASSSSSSATLPLPTATSPSPSSVSRRRHTTVTVSSSPSSITVPSELSNPRRGQKRPRANMRTCSSNSSTTTSTDDVVDGRRVCGGVFKPAVTFFGETLNDNVRRALEADKKKVDALIVIGTSLSV
jgi:NAD+-dependent protein deacetylase SIR2